MIFFPSELLTYIRPVSTENFRKNTKFSRKETWIFSTVNRGVMFAEETHTQKSSQLLLQMLLLFKSPDTDFRYTAVALFNFTNISVNLQSHARLSFSPSLSVPSFVIFAPHCHKKMSTVTLPCSPIPTNMNLNMPIYWYDHLFIYDWKCRVCPDSVAIAVALRNTQNISCLS